MPRFAGLREHEFAQLSGGMLKAVAVGNCSGRQSSCPTREGRLFTKSLALCDSADHHGCIRVINLNPSVNENKEVAGHLPLAENLLPSFEYNFSQQQSPNRNERWITLGATPESTVMENSFHGKAGNALKNLSGVSEPSLEVYD